MIIRTKWNLGFLALLATLAAPAANAALIDVMGGVSYPLDSFGDISGGGGTKGAIGYGGGLGLHFGLGSSVGLEVDGLYLNRSYQGGAFGISVTNSAGYIYVPAMLRFHLAHPVALGIGGYYDAPISSGNAPSDYGLTGSLRFYLAPTFFIDGRYNYGLKSGGTIVPGGDKNSEVMGLVGFSFGGGH